MRTISNAVIIITVIALLVLSNQVLALEAPIQVDIYPRGVDAKWVLAAETEMVIKLPSSFSADRIRYHALDGAKIDQVEAEYHQADDWVPEALVELNNRITETMKEIDNIEAKLAAIEQTIAYLDHNILPSQIDDPLEYMHEAQNMRVELEQKRQQLTDAITQANQDLQQLNQQLSQHYAGDIERMLVIKIVSNGIGNIELTAYSAHASWDSFYRATLNSPQSLVTLDSFVSVKQRTGIVFDGTIATHTASPSQDTTIVQLDPLVARIYDSQPVAASRAEMYRLGVDDKAASVEMTQYEGPVGVSFSGIGKVPSDNQPVMLQVASEDMPVEMFPTLVPHHQNEAWLLVESIQPVRPLLPGKAEFMVDGYLTGQSMLSHAGGDETLLLAFGKSPLITAEKTPIVYTERQTWLGRHVRRDGYNIEVVNGTSQIAEIEIIDRIPVSGHDRVKITADIDPEPVSEEEGILTWRLELEPGESRVISVEFEIEYPNNMELVIN